MTKPFINNTTVRKNPSSRNKFTFRLLFGGISVLFLILFILPGIALIWRTAMFSNMNNVPNFDSLIPPLELSLATTSISVTIIFLFGTPLAYVLAKYDKPLKKLITIFIELPIVMPPVVAGLALLSAFGRTGLLGIPLDVLGIQLTFTPVAVILVQIFVGAPFYIRTTQNRFGSIPLELEESARMDGASNWCIFRTIMIPLSRNAIFTGLILSWARALGEFGGTILFAGNLQGKTQTLPLFIYSALEYNLGATFFSATLMLLIALVLFSLTRVITKMDHSEEEISNIF